ncbi:RDD family protein [Cellulophaga baltica]|uniref:RDD family protein n=1 Tax=Cellulophaga TaxID=104264 RepID=UPI001C079EAE|nr:MULTISPECIES: RDD family protein [Cellulophaga]MBU2997366.1 RDD family protein [Cellulophaga baltica]MDO6768763.1 RDD family protein [Cellulophaga sp. 1_MG-2023]
MKSSIKTFWNTYILKKDTSSSTVKISDLKTYKTVNRRNTFGGIEPTQFEFKYNPNVEKFNLRLLCKVIDFLFYYWVTLIAEKYLGLSTSSILVSFVLLFALNPILESLTGRTLGKLLIGFQVIDDSCKAPSLLRAYLKNLLQLFNILFYVLSESIIWFDTFYFHNKLTATYTIWNKDKKKILAMLEKVKVEKREE